MKKLLQLTALLLCMQTVRIQAQSANPLSLTFGLSNGIPLKRQYGYALGGDLQLQQRLSRSLSATLTAGFNHYFETTKTEALSLAPGAAYPVSAPWNAIPLKAGIKVFAGGNFYLAAEAGAGLFLEGGKPAFLWSPAAGIAFPQGPDLSIRYEALSSFPTLSQVALRIAYAIPKQKAPAASSPMAEASWQLFAGASGGLSLDQTRFVAGADLELDRYLTENLALSLSAGFTHYTNKPYTFTYQLSPQDQPSTLKLNNGQNLIPLKLGIKVVPVRGMYVAGSAGLGVDINGNSSFVYSAAVGAALGKKADLSVKYEHYQDFYGASQLALRLGYRIF